MFLKRLSLINFKNIAQADLSLSDGINCFVGDNGAGKTNIIDAIHYLSMSKSALSMTDGQSVRHGEDFFMLNGDYLTDDGGHEAITCSFKRGSGKCLKRNGKEYERLSDHIGLIPAVIVSPGDVFLVNDAADERRKWLNAFISQIDREYLHAIIRYNHVLGERNRILKQSAGFAQEEMLDTFDMQLSLHGKTIHAKRAETVERLRPIVAGYYKTIADDREQVELVYRSDLNECPFEELFARNRQKDMVCQFTTGGIHRDDIIIKIGDHPLRKYGSQGQQKSLLIALKLAQYTILADQAGKRPVLLLDDLFDKLDARRLECLIGLVDDDRFGQTVISDCNRERLLSILEKCGTPYRLFTVTNGTVVSEEEQKPEMKA